jgi:restriction system protein
LELCGEIFTRVHPLWSVPAAAVVWFLVARVAVPTNPVAIHLRPVFNMVGIVFAMAVLGGGIIGWGQRSKRARFAQENLDLDWVRGLGWREFEEGVADIYRDQGYTVDLLGGSGPDGGIDLRMRRDGLTTVVQCKHWKTYKVGVKPIREFYGVMVSEGADHGVFITSGHFTREAESFAEGKPLGMIDRRGFLDLARQMQNNLRSEYGLPEDAKLAVDPIAEDETVASPACPLCAGEMVIRTARRGANAGSQFWGCSRFPGCRGTRPDA